MNKQDFLTSVNGKNCNVSVNGLSRFGYIRLMLKEVQSLKKLGFPVECTMNKNGCIELNNGQFFMPPPKPKINQKITLKSKYIVVGEMQVDKTNIKVVDENTFKTENFTYSII